MSEPARAYAYPAKLLSILLVLAVDAAILSVPVYALVGMAAVLLLVRWQWTVLVAAVAVLFAVFAASIHDLTAARSIPDYVLAVAVQVLPVAVAAIFMGVIDEPEGGTPIARFMARHAGRIRAGVLILSILLVLLLVSRRFSAIAVAIIVFALLASRRQLPRPEDADRVSLRSAVLAGCLMAFSVVLGLVILEVGARAFLREEARPPGIYEPHPAAIYRLRVNSEATMAFADNDGNRRPIHFRISAQGFRDRVYDPKEANEVRILMLGDSFTFGVTVAEEDTIPKQLERMLAESMDRKVSVVNAGVLGAGPWQERIALRERGLDLHPDLVILQLFPTNDMRDSLAREGKHLRSYYRAWQRTLARWRNMDLLRMRVDRKLAELSAAYVAFRNAVGPGNWTEFLMFDARFLPSIDPYHTQPSALRPPSIESNLRNWYPELEEAMRIMQEAISGIRDDCRARGVDLLVYSIPKADELREDRWERLTSDVEGVEYERLKVQRLLERFLAEQGIAYVSVEDALAAQPDLAEVYYLSDGHLTPKGNEIVAGVLMNYLMDEYL